MSLSCPCSLYPATGSRDCSGARSQRDGPRDWGSLAAPSWFFSATARRRGLSASHVHRHLASDAGGGSSKRAGASRERSNGSVALALIACSRAAHRSRFRTAKESSSASIDRPSRRSSAAGDSSRSQNDTRAAGHSTSPSLRPSSIRYDRVWRAEALRQRRRPAHDIFANENIMTLGFGDWRRPSSQAPDVR